MRHVVHILEATTGGTRRHLWHLATGLDASRIRQTLLVSCLRDPEFRGDMAHFEKLGLAVHEVPMLRNPAPFRDLSAGRQLLKLLQQLSPDIIHTHSSKAGMLGRWAAHRIKKGIKLHTAHVFAFEMQMPAHWRTIFLLLERLATRWTDRLVCVSKAEAAAAQLNLGRSCPPTHVIYNGVDMPRHCNPPQTGSRPAALLLGRICRQKGQDILAAALLKNPHLADAFRFDMVGTSPDSSVHPLVRRASEANLCNLHPACPQSESDRMLENCSVLLMPSRWEGMPYTLLEAMAAGRCAVASDVGGIPEVINNEDNGLLVPAENPDALAEALSKIADDPAMITRLGSAARKTISDGFQRQTMLSKLTELYEEF